MVREEEDEKEQEDTSPHRALKKLKVDQEW